VANWIEGAWEVSDGWVWVLPVAVVGSVACWLIRSARVRTVGEWFLVVAIACVAGFFASMFLNGLSNSYKAYGEVPIPGSAGLHLPAGDVVVSYHYKMSNPDDASTIPKNLELGIRAPNALPQPSVTDDLGDDIYTNESETHRQVKVAHIPVDGDYTITTNGSDSPSVNPHLAFGHDSRFGFLAWPLFPALIAVSLVASLIAFALRRRKSDEEPAISAAELLASGQRARGVLKSFTKAEATARSQAHTASSPELPGAPYYELQVQLWLPNRLPILGRNRQQVPHTEVSKLTIGRELDCAVDTADPAARFIVDWNHHVR
jgi:hypothetical protein